MLFIVNPIAGGGRALEKVGAIRDFCESHGISCEIVYTQGVGHATELASQNLDRDRIIVVGGDGTVREAAAGLLGTDVALGVIGCGTGNDLIKSLDIPAEMDLALSVAASGQKRQVDTISVDGRLIINVAGIGFDVDVVRNTEKYKKRFKGIGAYLMGIVSSLMSMRKFNIRVEAGGETFEANTLITSFANGRAIGGGMKVAPFAELDDGLIDVCCISDVPLIFVPFLLPKFISGSHVKLKYCKYFKAEKVDVHTDFPIECQIDGELFMLERLNFEINKKSLTVLV